MYLVDNSECSNRNLLNLLNRNIKIDYIENLENLGIAKALNIGCEKAKSEGYKWVLTLDQDSVFRVDLDNYIEITKKMISLDKSISIIGPKMSKYDKAGYVEKIITSGSIINLGDWKKVSGFREEFFIDEVDCEYCLKILKINKKIFQIEEEILLHKIGESFEVNFLLKKTICMNHNYIRKYYIFRNRLFMKDEFPQYKRFYLKANLRDFILVILFEKEKIRKIKYILKAYLDYRRGIKGKLND